MGLVIVRVPFVYEGVIIENERLRGDWEKKRAFPRGSTVALAQVPEGVLSTAPGNSYEEYRRGRDSACVDIVIATQLENGEPAVLLSLRKKGVCLGELWWIYGGALQSYTSIDEFISGRATKECGVPVTPEALIGVYRTMAPDVIGSTLQPCYAAFVPIKDIRAEMKIDDGHKNVALFTLKNLPKKGEHGGHWYPHRVATLAIKNLPTKSEYSPYAPVDLDALENDPRN